MTNQCDEKDWGIHASDEGRGHPAILLLMVLGHTGLAARGREM